VPGGGAPVALPEGVAAAFRRKPVITGLKSLRILNVASTALS